MKRKKAKNWALVGLFLACFTPLVVLAINAASVYRVPSLDNDKGVLEGNLYYIVGVDNPSPHYHFLKGRNAYKELPIAGWEVFKDGMSAGSGKCKKCPVCGATKGRLGLPGNRKHRQDLSR